MEIGHMATVNMLGSYALTVAGVDAAVTAKSAGAYALGHAKEGDSSTFIVKYAGRSDDDVGGRLKRWVENSPPTLHVPVLHVAEGWHSKPSASSITTSAKLGCWTTSSTLTGQPTLGGNVRAAAFLGRTNVTPICRD